MMDLDLLFDEVNQKHFDGFLEKPSLAYNARLKVVAGRFVPSRRSWFKAKPPTIEVASYLCRLEGARELVVDTLAHEMIHYWLWVMGRPHGHTPEFLKKMEEMGVSRYNSVPQRQEFKYLYECIHCLVRFPTRKRLHGQTKTKKTAREKGHYVCAKCKGPIRLVETKS